MKRTEQVNQINECEINREFHTHIVKPNYKKMLPVTPDYDYMKKGIFNKIGCFFSLGIFRLASLLVSPYCRLKIVGKENIKDLKSAIVTTNHINQIDCALVRKIFFSKKLKITVADFNNYKGLFGKILRGAGTMPFSSSMSAMKNLSNAIGENLKQDTLVVFYPEGALWWCYEKPRPLLDGAYHFAVKNNVPIIPMFFTFKNLHKRKDGTYSKKFIVHIGKPIYPLKDAPPKENIKYLKNQNLIFNTEIYERFYNKKLTYLSANKEIN